MRLIDADELLERMKKTRIILGRRCGKTLIYNTMLVTFAKFIELINNSPTVEERPKGMWKTAEKRDRYLRHITECICSNCEMNSDFLYRYCPYCGSDMSGEGFTEMVRDMKRRSDTNEID